MKNISMFSRCLFVLVMLVILAGCGGNQYLFYEVEYAFNLHVVDRQIGAETRENAIGRVKPLEEDIWGFEDSLVTVNLQLAQEEVEFFARALTGEFLRIDWEDAYFVDTRGYVHNIMVKNGGMSVTERLWALISPSTVSATLQPAGLQPSDSDVAETAALVNPRFGFATEDPRQAEPDTVLQEVLSRRAGDAVNKKVGFMLPMVIKDTPVQYTFWFEVINFQIRTARYHSGDI